MSDIHDKNVYVEEYNDNKITLLARDPHWLYAYWEISSSKKSSFKYEFGEGIWERSFPVLKITNVSKNLTNFIRINDFSNNWFINVEDSNALYVAELGRRVSDKFFINLACSNYVSTPGNSVSPNTNTCFMNYKDIRDGKLDKEAQKIYEKLDIVPNIPENIGLSSAELFENNGNELFLGQSSIELFKGNFRKNIGISSLK